ncbi:hypothetical protein TRVL_05897 [Trypanosoma vivax]|uniref:Uncharacterized protein n=1 Tax=Trypanosoma vivax (strain Y486) TaxID=1055687 RepID=F9WR49_TRYVY|nr:hypothetical protein TRVL_05897 [Trypanosoma vivax]CCD20033.1 hypothetical protein, conserved in T. vivax [Trypanosoma vivax Y486]|eukprot:CCD20033.1 hypothetical protein, conserved in T. vivax [Trypanosoma vivax Y486]
MALKNLCCRTVLFVAFVLCGYVTRLVFAEKARRNISKEEHHNAAQKIAGMYILYNDTFQALKIRAKELMLEADRALEKSKKLEEFLLQDNDSQTADAKKSIENAQRDAEMAQQRVQETFEAAAEALRTIANVLSFESTFILKTGCRGKSSANCKEKRSIINWTTHIIREGVSPEAFEKIFVEEGGMPLRDDNLSATINSTNLNTWLAEAKQLFDKTAVTVHDVAEAFVRPIVENCAKEMVEDDTTRGKNRDLSEEEEKRVESHIKSVENLLSIRLLEVAEKEFDSINNSLGSALDALIAAQTSERNERRAAIERMEKKRREKNENNLSTDDDESSLWDWVVEADEGMLHEISIKSSERDSNPDAADGKWEGSDSVVWIISAIVILLFFVFILVVVLLLRAERRRKNNIG